MDYFSLSESPLFRGLTSAELRTVLQETPHHIQCYEKGELIFMQMDDARQVGIILEGQVQGQKTFPNGSLECLIAWSRKCNRTGSRLLPYASVSVRCHSS